MNCIEKVIMRLVATIVLALLALSPAALAQERGYEAIERELMEEMRSILKLREELAAEKRQAETEERAVTESKSSGNVVGRFFLRRRMETLHERLTRISRIETEIGTREKRIEALHPEARAAIKRSGDDPGQVKRLEIVSGREVRRIEEALAAVNARLERPPASPREKATNEAEKARIEAELAEARRAFNAAYGGDR